MLDCGFSPLMYSLSDKNMRLGDVLLPPGGKQRCLYSRVQGLFTLWKVLLMQLSVCARNPVNCLAIICLPCIAVLSSFGRESSLVNIMGLIRLKRIYFS